MSVLSSIHGAASTILSNLFITLPYPEASPGLSSQTIIVTGSNTGLGYEASQHLLRLGVGKLIMAVRNLDKGREARTKLLKATSRSPDSVEVWHLDMSSYDSVKAFASQVNTNLTRLDGVLANAGILTEEFTLIEGNESTMTVNVVSTFLLFFLLLPKLRLSPSPARFVVPNSALHYLASTKDLVPDNNVSIFSRLNDPKRANIVALYNTSKLLVIYIMRELDSQMKKSGKQAVILNTPNPSYCKTDLLRNSTQTAPPDFLARTQEMGSRALVHAVLAGPETSGQYLTNCHVQA